MTRFEPFQPPSRLLLGPGDEVVIGVNGVFGGRMGESSSADNVEIVLNALGQILSENAN